MALGVESRRSGPPTFMSPSARASALLVALAASGGALAQPSCESATDVCACSALGSRCGWCSHSSTCKEAPHCTTTCRECPFAHNNRTACPECGRVCINTCPAAKTVCACAELSGCGWCNTTQRCTVYPECTTTCEECAWDCDRPVCLNKCYRRFRPHGRKRTLFPFHEADMLCTLAIFVAVIMASAAGIGGGAVLVPMFTMIGGFTEHEAIPLSIATIFGGSTFSVLFNFAWMPHPLRPHRHVIAYDAAVILMPMTLAGVSVGVYLNKVFPNWLIMVLLVLLCIYTGRRTLTQALRAYSKESVAMANLSATRDARRGPTATGARGEADGTREMSMSMSRVLSEDGESMEGGERCALLAARSRHSSSSSAAADAVALRAAADGGGAGGGVGGGVGGGAGGADAFAKRATMISPGVSRAAGACPSLGGSAAGGARGGGGGGGGHARGGGGGGGGCGMGGGGGDDDGDDLSGDLRDFEETLQGGAGSAFDGGGGGGLDKRDSALSIMVAKEGELPWDYLFMLARVWAIVVLLALLKGGHGMPSILGLQCGSPLYWAVVVSALPALFLLSKQGAGVVCQRHRHLVSVGYEYAEGDVIWTHERARHSCAVVGVAAIAAGLLGVGGGMVLGPIFLELQLNPQVASATSTFMVLLMASCTIAQFIIFGMLDQSFASWYGLVGVCGAVVGTKGAKALVEKTGRSSMLVFILAFLLFGSGALMLATGSVQLMRSGLTGFRSLCGRAGAAAAND
ncbi:hypothetical protein KFE25_004907 [Diacronema lutheri]|uniref:Sulfite exporter TauE/SafE family protein n=4 Tax=Diacronema lutheri TaxID=2081491 RepID=A0A8J5XD64_DIALT|nr:hypothetical protein KFE25_004907 [Diacronema lutheri]